MYEKLGFKRHDGLYHVDAFADTKSVTLDNAVIFKDEAFHLNLDNNRLP